MVVLIAMGLVALLFPAGCCNTTCLVFAAIALWYFGVVKFVWEIVRNKYERTTAPVIKVDKPKTEFPEATPAKEALSPMSAGQGKIQCYDKGLNAPIGVVSAFSTADVNARIQKAREAQKKWATSSFAVRRRLLHALMAYCIEEHELLCRTSAVEGGKTLLDGTLGEILTTCEKLSWTINRGEDVLQEEVRDVGLITLLKRASVRYEPFGVIGAVVSWNYPFHNIIGPMISALFAGNGFVGKVSEYSSYYASFYEGIVRDGIAKLGYDPNLVSIVTGFPEAGEAIVASCDKVTFIGSPQIGKKVMECASKTLTPVVLELGGKDPAVVCDDADMDQVIPIIMRGTFQNCGQNCVGLERVVAHAKVYDKMAKTLEGLVRQLSQGATTAAQGEAPCKDCGAMTMGPRACAGIQKLIDETVKQGGKVVAGGKYDPSKPNYFPPTMLIDVRPDMAIAQEEVFGPVLVLMKFNDDNEAVEMVNQCPYGLGSSVFSQNEQRALAIGRRLRTGMMNVNDFGINYLCQSLPFGGVKISGFDRFAGVEGLRGNCILRSETRDRLAMAKTRVPPLLQYPTTHNSFKFSKLLVRVLYGNISQMIGAIMGLITIKK